MSCNIRVSSAVLVILSLALVTQGAPSVAQDEAPAQGLQSEVGEWDAVVKFWVSPDTAPQESTATEEVRAIGDYWVVGEFHGNFGMEFEGLGQTGYDPKTKKYVGTWIDSMSSHLMTMKGKINPKTGKLVMFGSGIDHQTGEKKRVKQVSWTNDDSTRTFEMYWPVDTESANDENASDDKANDDSATDEKAKGKKIEWWKIMEIVYTRK